MPQQPPRRVLALAGSALVLSVLTSCGFDASTNRVYTPAVGVNDRDGDVDVLNALIVSAEEGSGTFVASLANNDDEEAATFSGLSALEQGSLEAPDVEPVEIPAGGFVNLADEGGVEVTGDFTAGDFVGVVVELEDGDRVELEIPVVTNCGEFAGIDGPVDEAACEPEHESGGH